MILCKHCFNPIQYYGKQYHCSVCNYQYSVENGIIDLSGVLDENNNYFPEDFFDTLYKIEENSFWFKVRNAIISQTIIQYLPPPADIIEVGSGTGYVASSINTLGYAVDCADLFTEALEFCIKRNAGHHYFTLNLKERIFVEEYDAVCAFDVIEHVENDLLALTNMYHLLKNDGYAFITVPACPSLWNAGDVFAEHKRRYTLIELRKRVEEAGFQIKKITYFMTLLFPILYMKRKFFVKSLDNESCMQDGKYDYLSELNPNPLLNKFLYNIFSIEPFLLKHMNLPIGSSILCVAQKKEGSI